MIKTPNKLFLFNENVIKSHHKFGNDKARKWRKKSAFFTILFLSSKIGIQLCGRIRVMSNFSISNAKSTETTCVPRRRKDPKWLFLRKLCIELTFLGNWLLYYVTDYKFNALSLSQKASFHHLMKKTFFRVCMSARK